MLLLVYTFQTSVYSTCFISVVCYKRFIFRPITGSKQSISAEIQPLRPRTDKDRMNILHVALQVPEVTNNRPPGQFSSAARAMVRYIVSSLFKTGIGNHAFRHLPISNSVSPDRESCIAGNLTQQTALLRDVTRNTTLTPESFRGPGHCTSITPRKNIDYRLLTS